MTFQQTAREENFSGAFTALITPFHRGEIDEPALRALVEFQVAGGINGLVPCGTTGESATMSDREQERVIEIVIDQTRGRVPVIAGTGSNGTATTIARTRQARAAGATAALLVVPYYNKPTQAGLICHYTAIAEATDLPLILYNVPGRTGINMTPETVLQLAEIPTVVGIKEASGNLDQASEIAIGAPADFVVLSGDDSLTLPIISVGGRGVISVVSNIVPAEVTALCSAALQGDFAAARRMHQQLFNLSRAMFLENNPTGVKTAASILGLCQDELRLPLTELSAANRVRLEQAMRNYGLGVPVAMAAD